MNRYVKDRPSQHNTLSYALFTLFHIFSHAELPAFDPTAITPTPLTARIHELVSACFTGIWLETCEPEEACREISNLCQTQSWLTCPHD